jgi:hypothetical protein
MALVIYVPVFLVALVDGGLMINGDWLMVDDSQSSHSLRVVTVYHSFIYK